MTTLKALAVSSWDLSKAPRNLRFLVDDEGNLITMPVIPVDPTLTSPIQPIGATCLRDPVLNSAARCYGDWWSSGVSDASVGLITNARIALYSSVAAKWQGQLTDYSSTNISAANTAQTVTLPPAYHSGLKSMLDVRMTCSAGTATLNVEVSQDNVTWIALDAIAAAAATVLHYDTADVGATIGLNPMTFPFVRFVAGAAGAGNTTTMVVCWV